MTDLPMTSDGGAAPAPRPRHPLNAPGPFYTEAICSACCVSEVEAPDLMGFDDDLHAPSFGCFFKKQPETPEELDRAFDAMTVNCIDTLRYGGRDPAILQRLRELGLEDQCDYPLPKPPVSQV